MTRTAAIRGAAKALAELAARTRGSLSGCPSESLRTLRHGAGSDGGASFKEEIYKSFLVETLNRS